VCRTLVYSAPEVLRHDEYYTKDGAPPLYNDKADVWSYGMCVRAVLTGERSPYRDIEKNAAIEKALLSGRSPDLQGITSEFWLAFVLDCLHQDPELRWSAERLRKRLKKNKRIATEETPSSSSSSSSK
jgi:serine/threonine protein kinase